MKQLRIRLVSVVAVLVLVATACANSGGKKSSANKTGTTTGGQVVHVDQPGVSDTEIRVGAVTSKTNPLGGNYGDLDLGIKAYFAMVNAGGGIYNRKLNLASERDDALATVEIEGYATSWARGMGLID